MTLPMKEIAARIHAHLKRFEADKAINKPSAPDRLHPYYEAQSYYPGGAKISVVYISFQGASHLTRAEAMAYLEWLDAGNVGRHYEQQRTATVRKKRATRKPPAD